MKIYKKGDTLVVDGEGGLLLNKDRGGFAGMTISNFDLKDISELQIANWQLNGGNDKIQAVKAALDFLEYGKFTKWLIVSILKIRKIFKR